MLSICSWLQHGCLLTSMTVMYFILNISQPAGVMLMLRVKWSEQWLYLAVVLHLLPSWDLSSHWWWLTHIYSSPLCSSYIQIPVDVTENCPRVVLLIVHSVLMFFSATCSACAPISTLSSPFLFTSLRQKRRILLIWLFDWLNECLTDSLSSKAACITTVTWPQSQTAL